jgi:SWI/SNF-related matrix-associated actin-dependent regulator 1 of chromatin subfamily A
VVTLTGDHNQTQRQTAVETFQAGDADVFIGTIGAAGVGITLTAASHVVFAELSWVPGDVSQAEDRCHRIGQQDSVLIQHLVVDGSLDARMAEVLVQTAPSMTGKFYPPFLSTIWRLA